VSTQDPTPRTVHFDDEAQLQDVLAGRSIGSSGTLKNLKQEAAGGPMIVIVPGKPRRILKSTLGGDLILEPLP
jgi:hypothetical protein